MKIPYWSDYACPYCYIGEARLHQAIRELGVEKEIELEPRAFELDPHASREVQSDTATRFAKKYGLSVSDAKARIEHISALGRAEGIDFKYADTRYTNTFDAHRLMKLALSKNDRALAERTNQLLFDAYFTKNRELADTATLLEVARLAGLDEAEAADMLASDRFAAEVRADERKAMERGVRGVPYFVFPGGLTVPGTLSLADFKDAVSRALAHEKADAPAGAQCGQDGCVIPR